MRSRTERRTESGGDRAVARVALLSVHTCPLDQPGTGDSGGMNVYVRAVAHRLAEMGVSVDAFSRWSGNSERVREVEPGVRVIHLAAGPPSPVPKQDLGNHLSEFLYSLLNFDATEATRLGTEGPVYDIVHSNYWLSGRVGRLAAERWERPLVHSFHTIGRVKNQNLGSGDTPEPAARIAAEDRIVQTADCLLAPTADEAADLIAHGARPDRVRVVPPGVDTDVFKPGSRSAARRRLGLDDRRPVVLFVGRLQPLKSPDIAVRALAEVVAADPELDPVLVMIGGPSGATGIGPEGMRALAGSCGAADRLMLRAPVPHAELADYYRAADVVIVPSRSESFGLVALEAAACGTPVVATDVGGLRTTVRHGATGLLVPGADPAAFARALADILSDPARAGAMGDAATRFARRFDWRCAAAGLLEVYEDLTGERSSARSAEHRDDLVSS
ncbi:MAG: D-inositol-3-phosphate glycosyltransferase [Actinomycetota bacterium]